MEVRILPLGGMDFPKHRLVRCQDPEEMLFSPAWAVLIQSPTLVTGEIRRQIRTFFVHLQIIAQTDQLYHRHFTGMRKN